MPIPFPDPRPGAGLCPVGATPARGEALAEELPGIRVFPDCREEQYPCTRLYSVHKPCKQCLNEICFYRCVREGKLFPDPSAGLGNPSALHPHPFYPPKIPASAGCTSSTRRSASAPCAPTKSCCEVRGGTPKIGIIPIQIPPFPVILGRENPAGPKVQRPPASRFGVGLLWGVSLAALPEFPHIQGQSLAPRSRPVPGQVLQVRGDGHERPVPDRGRVLRPQLRRLLSPGTPGPRDPALGPRPRALEILCMNKQLPEIAGFLLFFCAHND